MSDRNARADSSGDLHEIAELVERLRDYHNEVCYGHPICDEAADEIERNRKEIDGLLELLRKDRTEIERLQGRIDVLHEHDGTMCPLCAMDREIEHLRSTLKRIAAGGDDENFDAAFSHEANVAMRLQDIARDALEDDDECK